MKNIHVIPTDKPSRVYLIKLNNKLGITSNNPEFTENFGSGTQNQNIYITSDEEIKEGDWVIVTNIANGLIFVKQHKGIAKTLSSPRKKIILTTDLDLIKDGVQTIDDEFLEWFVKNPSYEEVYIIKQYKQVNQDNPLHKGSTALRFSHYEIHLLKATKQMIDEWNLIYCKLKSRQIPIKEEPKQETLEEAEIYNYKELYEGEPLTQDVPIDAFKQGAKWQQQNSNVNALHFEIDSLKREIKVLKHQQERNYSEEDFKLFARQYYREIKLDKSNLLWDDLADKCLEQFKNK